MHEIHLTQKFFIVIVKIVPNVTDVLNWAFELLWNNSLLDSHILISEQSHTWTLYTFIPFHKSCFNLTHVKIAEFTLFNFTNPLTIPMHQLYPEKLKNFNNCSLYVAPSINEPFVYGHGNSENETQWDGVDIDIVKHISKALNFQIIYKRVSNGTGHGMVLDDGTATGNIALVKIYCLFWK